MKVWKNGVLIEEAEDVMTEEPIAEPSAEERLAILEAAMLELLGLSNVDDLYHK